MRVLYVLPTQAFGGAERQALLHIKRLPEYGHHVVAVVGPGQPMCQALRDAGVSDFIFLKHMMEETHARMSLWGNIRYCYTYFRTAMRASQFLTEVARQHEIDVMFACRSIGWIVAAPVAHRLKIPCVMRAGSRPFHPVGLLGAYALRFLWGKPAALVSNCQAVDDIFAPILRCKHLVLPNGTDLDRFDPQKQHRSYRPQDDEDHATLVVGLASRPAPDKGFDFLPEVVTRVRKRFKHFVVLIAGDYGWRSHYENLYRSLGLDSHIKFLGYVKDIEAFYASCDVVILTSRQRSIEASPNAVLEAMAASRPIVATQVGGVEEAITHGIEGLLSDPDDVDGFSENLLSLLEDPALRERIGRAGRQRVSRDYSEARAMEILTGVLEAATSR